MNKNYKPYTVRDLLLQMTGAKSFGLYDVDGNWISTDVTATEVLAFEDEDIDHFSVFVYDEPHQGKDGKVDYVLHPIHCNIYLTKKKSDYGIEENK